MTLVRRGWVFYALFRALEAQTAQVATAVRRGVHLVLLLLTLGADGQAVEDEVRSAARPPPRCPSWCRSAQAVALIWARPQVQRRVAAWAAAAGLPAPASARVRAVAVDLLSGKDKDTADVAGTARVRLANALASVLSAPVEVPVVAVA